MYKVFKLLYIVSLEDYIITNRAYIYIYIVNFKEGQLEHLSIFNFGQALTINNYKERRMIGQVP